MTSEKDKVDFVHNSKTCRRTDDVQWIQEPYCNVVYVSLYEDNVKFNHTTPIHCAKNKITCIDIALQT